jgi:hypothetical protein
MFTIERGAQCEFAFIPLLMPTIPMNLHCDSQYG